jgi:ABC-2 type transport system permease protein
MSAVAAERAEGDLAALPRVLWTQFVGQFIGTLRVPAFWVASLILPVMFFTFFGLPNAHFKYSETVSFGAYLLASYGAYSVTSVMLFSFGIGVATERAGKVDLLLRASPLPPAAYLLAKILNAICFAFASLAILFIFGFITAGVSESPATWAGMIVKLLIGALPFLLLGFAIGYLFSPNAAPAVVNLVFFPMSFASGVFVPLQFLPSFVRDIAPYMPTYHLAQLAWNSVGVKSESPWTSAAWLLGYASVFFVLTFYAIRRDETSKFR